MVKCFECKVELDKNDAEKVNISTIGKVANKYFHPECKDIYLQKRQDNGGWIELYEYVKHEILGYKEEMSLSLHLIRRLKGIRSGQYVAKKGTASLSKKGYPYKVILMTFKIKKIDILNAIYDKNRFKDEKHREDYIMAIILNSINDVYLRMLEREKTENKLENVDFKKFETKNDQDFIDKSVISENKVAKILDNLW